MINVRNCPNCRERRACLVYSGVPEVIDDNLVLNTEYVCSGCRAVFNERMHYSIKYEYTETVLQIDEEEDE